MNSLQGSRPGFLQRFLLPRSQHEGFKIPKKNDDRIFSELAAGLPVSQHLKAHYEERKRCSDAGS
ncbi:MAG: hypothetical protein ACKON9_31105 [Planctomycetaceae bacterium]